MSRPRPYLSGALGALLSLCFHGGVALVLVTLPSPEESARASRPDAYLVALDPVLRTEGAAGADARGASPTSSDRAIPGGTESAQNIDADDRGQGGDRTGAERGILLMHRSDGIVLFDSPLNNLAAAQTQRIRTARSRATLERRRATPNPRDDAFLALGPGEHPERRPVRATDAAEGARVAPIASVRGAMPSTEARGLAAMHAEGAGTIGEGRERALRRASPATSADPGTESASPGRGILRGEGARHSEAARVADGRPPVDQGPAATQAERADARVRDEDDAELLAGSMIQSWVEATARTAPRAGEGRGGVGGGGTPGSGGGRHEGGRSAAYGPGDGRYAALDTSDGRYRRWFLVARRRVQDALRFPQERALSMDQGVSIYTLTVRRDGTLAEAPRLVRSSGFDDMDEAALAAIRAATPFGPLPDDLAPDLERVRIRLPIEFSNPMVR